tara:strand:+ start:349 stop:717 length:369 start_codon:yes stop_codon:yes gene_type:complete
MKDKIRLKDGKAYRGDKLVAWYDGDELKFKHWKFKSLKEEIEALAEVKNTELIPKLQGDPEPQYPQELIKEGKHGAWFGEEHPYVVEWRKANWSKESFDKKYAHQYELLCNNYDAEGMKYQP